MAQLDRGIDRVRRHARQHRIVIQTNRRGAGPLPTGHPRLDKTDGRIHKLPINAHTTHRKPPTPLALKRECRRRAGVETSAVLDSKSERDAGVGVSAVDTRRDGARSAAR